MKRGDKVRVIATQETGIILRVCEPRDRSEPIWIEVDQDQGDLFNYMDGEKPCPDAFFYRYTPEKLEVL